MLRPVVEADQQHLSIEIQQVERITEIANANLLDDIVARLWPVKIPRAWGNNRARKCSRGGIGLLRRINAQVAFSGPRSGVGVIARLCIAVVLYGLFKLIF